VAESWYWDAAVGRYRDAGGRYLSRSEVISFVNESIAASNNAMGPLARYMSAGQLSPADFSILVRNEIKQDYIRQYLLGIGGREQMTQGDWGRLGRMLRDQYGFLDKFTAELSGLSEAQIMARLEMYTNASREAYERAHGLVAKRLGMDEEHWYVSPEKENCDSCLAAEAQGWQPIETFPEPGAGDLCEGFTNCGCEKGYRNSETGDEY
jgi:hypothetical protein